MDVTLLYDTLLTYRDSFIIFYKAHYSSLVQMRLSTLQETHDNLLAQEQAGEHSNKISSYRGYLLDVIVFLLSLYFVCVPLMGAQQVIVQ